MLFFLHSTVNPILRMPMAIQQGASTSSQGPSPTPAELPLPLPMINGTGAGPALTHNGAPSIGAASLAVRPQFQPQQQGLPPPPPPFSLFYQHPFMSPPPCQLPPGPSRDFSETVIRSFRMPAPSASRFKSTMLDSTDTETEVEPAETESEDMEDTEDTEDTEEEEED